MTTIRDLLWLYRIYRTCNGRRDALRMAWRNLKRNRK